MNELEEKAYAYAIERQKDPNYPVYNWETEITDAYEQGYKEAIDHPSGGELLHVLNKGCAQGYKDAVDKACEWLRNNHADIFIRYIRGYEADDEIELLKKYMEKAEEGVNEFKEEINEAD